MKTLTLILSIAAICGGPLCGEETEPMKALTQPPSPPPGRIAADLFWVADSRKMDEFLARVELPFVEGGAGSGEVLPDTRTAWRDYAREAQALANKGRVEDAARRLAQMLKLAAVYRTFGGLENTVQSEEIRYLAGITAEKLGSAVTASIQSPYLEKNATQCLALLESGIGEQIVEITASFRNNLARRALETHARLSQAGRIVSVTAP